MVDKLEAGFMKPWVGGTKPTDWDGNSVQFRSGEIRHAEPGVVWKLGWDHSYGSGDIIAYSAATPANSEQVERAARAIAVRRGYDQNGDQLTPAGYPWWQQFTPDAEAALATFSTPTEDAWERVKVLEQALGNLLTYIGHDGKRVYSTDLVVVKAILALGNKETDRHG